MVSLEVGRNFWFSSFSTSKISLVVVLNYKKKAGLWNDRMTEWQDGRIAEWQNSRMAEWQNGRMAE